MVKVMCGWCCCKHNSSKEPGILGECIFEGEVNLKYANAETLIEGIDPNDADNPFIEALVCEQANIDYDKFWRLHR